MTHVIELVEDMLLVASPVLGRVDRMLHVCCCACVPVLCPDSLWCADVMLDSLCDAHHTSACVPSPACVLCYVWSDDDVMLASLGMTRLTCGSLSCKTMDRLSSERQEERRDKKRQTRHGDTWTAQRAHGQHMSSDSTAQHST